MKEINIFIRTKSIKNDNRLQKEINTIVKEGYTINLVAIENTNKIENFTTPKYKTSTKKIFSRNLFKRGKFLWVKILEMHLHFLVHYLKYMRKQSSVFWIHNLELLGMIIILRLLCSPKTKIIWDTHELFPNKFSSNFALNRLIKLAINSCTILIAANEERCKFIKEKFNIPSNKLQILNNYPTVNFIDSPSLNSNQTPDFEYFLFQGVAYDVRGIEEVFEATLNFPNYKLLILGPFLESEKIKLINKYGINLINEKIYNTGFISLNEMQQYIDGAKISFIFYKDIDMNHILCEPNRFYEAIGRGIPIICGKNIPMRKIIDKFKCGISINDYGTDAKAIDIAIRELLDNYDVYKKNISQIKYNFSWENQEYRFKHIL